MTECLQKKLSSIFEKRSDKINNSMVFSSMAEESAFHLILRRIEKDAEEAVRDIASSIHKKKIKVDKLPNPNEQITMTKKEWAKEFNREVDEIKELLVGSSPTEAKE